MYAHRAAPALARPHVVFLLRPFDPRDWSHGAPVGRSIGSGVRIVTAPPPARTQAAGVSLGTISPAGRLVFSIAFLLAFFLVGLPLVRWGAGRFEPVVIAVAPAVGAGVVTLAGVAVVAILD
jgi:hypothetical protein